MLPHWIEDVVLLEDMLAQQFRILLQIVGENLAIACLQGLLHILDTVSGQLMLMQHLRDRVAMAQNAGRFQIAEQDVFFLGMVWKVSANSCMKPMKIPALSTSRGLSGLLRLNAA